MGYRSNPSRRGDRRCRSGRRWIAGAACWLVASVSCTNEQVVSVDVASVQVTPSSASALEGEAVQLTATVLDDDQVPLEGAPVVWSSQDTSIATVDGEGVVRARGDGVTTVRATFRTAWGESTVRVLPGPEIALSRDSVALSAGVGAEPPEPETLQVTNGGGATIDGVEVRVEHAEGTPRGWLTARLDDTSLPARLTLSAEPEELASGTYRADVVVSAEGASNSPVSLPVTLSLSGFSVRESGGGTSVGESGPDDTFTVVLDLRPEDEVVLTVESDDPGEVDVSPRTLTFEPDDWNEPRTVTVEGVDDEEQDGDRESTVVVAVDEDRSDDAFRDLPDAVVRVVTRDDDAAGFTVDESGGGTTVDESGTTDEIRVRLTARPSSSVSIAVRSADPGQATVEPASIRIAPDDWDEASTVTVRGVDDADIDGDRTTDLTLSVVDAESDDAFDGAPDRTVAVTTRDDDSAGVVPTESGGSTSVAEGGGTDEVSVVLSAAPAADVVLTALSADPEEMTVAPSTLRFTPANWDTPQTLTVRGVDDALADGDQVTTLTVAVDDAASDDGYDGVGDATIQVTTTDDDGAALVVSETGGASSVTEAAGTDEVTVALASQPLSSVTLDVASGDEGEVVASPAALTFTSATWSTPQRIVLTGVDDSVADGPQISAVSLSVRDGSDPAYGAVADVTVEVTTADDDVPGFTVVQSGGTAVGEAGGTDDLSVVLTTEPESQVVLTLVSGDEGALTVAPASITFTPGDWSTPKSVTVTGVDESTADEDQVVTLTIAVDDAASDGAFAGVASQSVDVTVRDDDVAGFAVNETEGTTVVTESGGRDDVSVVLLAQPLSDVVLTLTASDPSEATVSPRTMTFTPVNWNVAQVATVTGVNDIFLDGDRQSTLAVAVDAASSDDAFDGAPVRNVTVTTRDGILGLAGASGAMPSPAAPIERVGSMVGHLGTTPGLAAQRRSSAIASPYE